MTRPRWMVAKERVAAMAASKSLRDLRARGFAQDPAVQKEVHWKLMKNRSSTPPRGWTRFRKVFSIAACRCSPEWPQGPAGQPVGSGSGSGDRG